MLPAHIIEKILEQEKRNNTDNRVQPALELPLVPFEYTQATENKSQRGVIVIDLLGE